MRNKILVVVLGVMCIILNHSCQEEEIITEASNLEKTLPIVNVADLARQNITITNWSHVKDKNPKLAEKVSKFSLSTTNSRTTSDTYGFSIDENRVQIMEVDSSYTTYTFLVERDTYVANTIENYVFKSYVDDSYEQLLLSYNYTIGDDGDFVFDADYLGIQVINDEGLIFTRGTNCLPELLNTKEIETCYNTTCTSEDGVNHEVGDDCDCGEVVDGVYYDCQPPGTYCYTQTVYVTTDDNCGGVENPNNDGNPYDPPAGGGNGNNNTSDETNFVPLFERWYANQIISCVNRQGDDNITISQEQINFLYTRTNAQNAATRQYLVLDNDCSVEAKEFTVLALEALQDNDNDGQPDGEVDFEENIIYESSFNDYPCQKLIIQDASGSCSPLTNTLINIFESNDSMNLIFKTSPTIPSNANTSVFTQYNPSTGTCNITITFRESYLETATDLAIARTTIHESLHALFSYMYDQGLLESDDGTPLEGFEDLLKAYTDYMSGLPPNFNAPHHELMADFVEDMATSLSIYAINNNHTQSFDFYEKLSWGGLTSTDAFNTLYPQLIDSSLGPVIGNTNFDRYDINRKIIAEQKNENQTLTIDGTTYIYTPQGNTPNIEEPCN